MNSILSWILWKMKLNVKNQWKIAKKSTSRENIENGLNDETIYEALSSNSNH